MPWVLWLAVALAACSSTESPHDRPRPPDGGGAPPPLDGLAALTISPTNQTLVTDGTTPAIAAYRAVGTFGDGHTEDVSDRVTFTVADVALGQFAGATLTTTTLRGGTSTVSVFGGGQTAATTLTLVYSKRVDPDGLAGGLAGSAGGAAPSVVYPNDGVLVPSNLGSLEIHFRPASGQSVFEIAFASAWLDVKVDTRCPLPASGGCIYNLGGDLWSRIAATARGDRAIAVTVRGSDGAGGAIGVSSAVQVSISADDIMGGLYYWTTSNGTGIMRYDFAGTQTTAEEFLGTNLTGGTCVGCHALSRDGTKLVAEAGGQNDGRLLILDVAHATPLAPFGSPERSIFESWSPDGARFVGVYGDRGATDYNLLVLDGASGQLITDIAGTGWRDHPADHPDWSPDGERIAFVRVGTPNTLQQMFGGAIELVSAGASGWSPPVELVAAAPGKNRYYPAFSPDGALVVFDESTCGGGATGDDCNADSDPSARLFAVAVQGGAPVELARANAPGAVDGGRNLTTSFPKWSPFVFHGSGEPATRLEWITFSSTRRYGLRPPPATTPGGQAVSGTLIWMAAIDPDRALVGEDASWPAFALPFQDLTTSNHIAQWTEKIVGTIR
jgi:hypothetical protein